MRAIILGSGSAVPDPERGGPAVAIAIDDDIILIDCGERATTALVTANLNPLRVDHLFFTHLHRDHMADYGWFVMTCRTCGRKDTLNVFGPPGTRDMSDAFIHGVYRADVEYTRQYAQALPPHITDRPLAEPALNITEIEPGFTYSAPGFRVTAGAVQHHQRVGMESVAYRVDSRYGSIAVSGDTRPCESMIELAKDADLLIHENAFLAEIIDQRKMWSHSSPAGAGSVARRAGVKQLVLTHLGPYTANQAACDLASMYYGQRRGPDVWDRILAEAKAEFSGPVTLAHDGLTIEIGRDTGTNQKEDTT